MYNHYKKELLKVCDITTDDIRHVINMLNKELTTDELIKYTNHDLKTMAVIVGSSTEYLDYLYVLKFGMKDFLQLKSKSQIIEKLEPYFRENQDFLKVIIISIMNKVKDTIV